MIFWRLIIRLRQLNRTQESFPCQIIAYRFLADLYHAQKIIPATVTFVDIAGLVAGASKGEGLGNKFLHNIRECDAIVHVVRAFENSKILRHDESTD